MIEKLPLSDLRKNQNNPHYQKGQNYYYFDLNNLTQYI